MATRRMSKYARGGNSYNRGSVGSTYTQRPGYSSGGRRAAPLRSTATDLNYKMLLITLGVGAACWLIEYLLYNRWSESISKPLLIGLLFAILGLALAIIISFVSAMDGTNRKSVTGDGLVVDSLVLIGIVLVLFGLGVLLQWLYGMGLSSTSSGPTSYVFVIDNSGSMEGNDPNMERYEAIEQVMLGMDDDFPFMVYGFTDEVQELRSMEPKKNGNAVVGFNSGGTNIKLALEHVLADYKSGKWEGGVCPRVILLSDGASSGFYRPVLKAYSEEGISISTVGLGSAKASLMTRIAERTGGVYVPVQDISMLATAMEDASHKSTGNDLLSVRMGTENDLLYGVLRVLFLTLLGAVVGAIKVVGYGDIDSATITFLGSIVTSFVGALVMELGTSLGCAHTIPWLILWLLVGASVCLQVKLYYKRQTQGIAGDGHSYGSI